MVNNSVNTNITSQTGKSSGVDNSSADTYKTVNDVKIALQNDASKSEFRKRTATASNQHGDTLVISNSKQEKQGIIDKIKTTCTDIKDKFTGNQKEKPQSTQQLLDMNIPTVITMDQTVDSSRSIRG
ncbi:MAG: hypothetical protein AB1782_18740 [Cyanobacteriota bacterium]